MSPSHPIPLHADSLFGVLFTAGMMVGFGLVCLGVFVALRGLFELDGKTLFASRESSPGGQRAVRGKHRPF